VTNRRPHLILVGLIALALAGVAALGIPGSPAHKKVTLGLDLQGGLEVVLRAVPPKGHKLTSEDLDRSVNIMRNRIDKLGVSEPEIRKQGSDQIVIELAGVHDQKRAFEIIGKTAQLELYDLETSVTGPSASSNGGVRQQPNLFQLLIDVQNQAKKGEPSAYYLFDRAHRLRAGPEDTKAKLLASLQRPLKRVPKGWRILPVPQNAVVVSCGSEETACPGESQGGDVIAPPPPGTTYYYLFKHDLNAEGISGVKGIPQLTGKDLKLGGTRQDFDNGQPIVLMQFTGHGGRQFEHITQEEWNRGKTRGTPQHFAIVLDREIKSFPQIDSNDRSLAGGISGGSAQITGIDSIGEAKDLALVLQTGALPVNFEPIERTDVSATLGKDSLQEAKIAALIGLALVAVFLLLFYRFLGLVAVIGLGIYGAFLYAAILLFGVTLTLPGFAGLVLTIGVAADANIVVFERIKEEVRAGKSVRAAIAAGYSKGFHTIIDANVVTVITAFVLFALATAGVKGFALMLMIGTAISLITAVAATRALLGLLAGFRWFDNPSFMGAQGQQTAKWLQIDFMGRRNLWFALSGVIILVGAVSLGVRGLNFGIDFKGGTQVTFKTKAPVALDQVRSEARRIGQGDAVIQGRGSQVDGKYTNFQLRTKSLSQAKQDTLTRDLQERLGAQPPSVKNVSASFGRQIADAAIKAILISLFLIVLYIAFRFEFKFALPVIAALLHDIVITVGVYSLTGREVTNATVAAVLTVLGYSIYDTIIIFDRVRENVPLMRRQPFATIANVSLWETIRRSLATSFITLLPVGSLLLFGGDTLKDFAFALLVGITSGAYSSIFIAAPLLTMWKEREPEFARRKGVAVPAGDGRGVLEEATEAAAAEPAPEMSPVAAVERAAGASQSKRERRRQRRRARPHGRAR
jgi:SecD/SecF fusion protein